MSSADSADVDMHLRWPGKAGKIVQKICSDDGSINFVIGR